MLQHSHPLRDDPRCSSQAREVAVHVARREGWKPDVDDGLEAVDVVQLGEGVEAPYQRILVIRASSIGWSASKPGRDYDPRFADLREPREGDRFPGVAGSSTSRPPVEVGHVFNFGSYYSAPLEASFLDEDGRERVQLGGGLRHRPGPGDGGDRRTASSTRTGSPGRREVAPYDVHVVALHGPERSRPGRVAALLDEAGLSVILDDRDDLRPGDPITATPT